MINLTCKNNQKIKVTFSPVTSLGASAALQGLLTISVVSGTGTFEYDPAYAMQLWLVSSNDVGSTVYRVEGDADLGEGVETLSLEFLLDVTSANAVSLGATAETPINR